MIITIIIITYKIHITIIIKIISTTIIINNKTTAVRLLPAIGKTVGDSIDMGGLLGLAPVMPVHPQKSSDFINVPSLKVALSDILKFFKSIPINLKERESKDTSLLRLFLA